MSLPSYSALVPETEEGPADWATGLVKALRFGDWGVLIHDRECQTLLAPVLAVARLGGREPRLGIPEDWLADIKRDARDVCTTLVGAIALYWFNKFRDDGVSCDNRPRFKVRRKHSRNRRCPCSSGRKFKACCGIM